MPAEREEPSAPPEVENNDRRGTLVAPLGRPDGSSPPLGRGMRHPYGGGLNQYDFL